MLAALYRAELVDSAKDRLGPGGDHPLTDAEGVYLPALGKDRLDRVLVQTVGYDDLRIGKSSLVQHDAGLFGEIGKIAAVDTDTIASRPDSLLLHLPEDLDRMGHTGIEHVVSIDQQDAIVRIAARKAAKSRQFILKQHDPAVGHGARNRDIKALTGQHRGRAFDAADDAGAGTVDRGIVVMGAARTEIRDGAAVSRTDNTLGFGRDQALVVELRKNFGFYQLRLGDIGDNGNDRLVRVDNAALGKGIDIAVETEVFEIMQKALVKLAKGTEIFHILRRKIHIDKIIDNLLQSCENSKAALVGIAAIENVKSNFCSLALRVQEIAVGHGKLVEIHHHGRVIGFTHALPSLPDNDLAAAHGLKSGLVFGRRHTGTAGGIDDHVGLVVHGLKKQRVGDNTDIGAQADQLDRQSGPGRLHAGKLMNGLRQINAAKARFNQAR